MENGLSHNESGFQETQAAIENATQRTAEALDVAAEVLEEIQKVVSAGRPRAVRVRFGDRTVAELPVALTAAAAVAAGLLAVLLTKLAIEVIHEE